MRIDAMTMQVLDNLQSLYAAGFHDSFIDNALRKIVERQVERDEADLQRIEGELRRFETAHKLSSDEFWQQFQSGELSDSADYMEWNAFCKMRNRIRARLHILRGESAT
ncbi:MAG: hypothetical protein KDD91_16795 [Caldilinea sp.]|nr:hypothetical protein [Caldilinea sp.]MCB0042555.1 hypothetical protein [Caldilinea sp.]MCB9123764.1 hypothetical protein [Caldilineaceae bacterium]